MAELQQLALDPDKPSGEPEEDQVQQAYRHGRPSCPSARPLPDPRVTGTGRPLTPRKVTKPTCCCSRRGHATTRVAATRSRARLSRRAGRAPRSADRHCAVRELAPLPLSGAKFRPVRVTCGDRRCVAVGHDGQPCPSTCSTWSSSGSAADWSCSAARRCRRTRSRWYCGMKSPCCAEPSPDPGSTGRPSRHGRADPVPAREAAGTPPGHAGNRPALAPSPGHPCSPGNRTYPHGAGRRRSVPTSPR